MRAQASKQLDERERIISAPQTSPAMSVAQTAIVFGRHLFL
jgi:hypothetical protein